MDALREVSSGTSAEVKWVVYMDRAPGLQAADGQRLHKADGQRPHKGDTSIRKWSP